MMDDEPERMDPRCDAGGRGSMLWMEYCNDGEYVRATDYDALAAKLSGVVVDPSSPEFINTFMRPAKTKAARHKRTMVVLNAQHMIDEEAFQ